MRVDMNTKEQVIFLYGTDGVTMSERKEAWIKKYFKGGTPDITVIEAPGSYEAYQSALGGQSLFTADSVVILENPFFFKKSPATKKEEKAFALLIETLTHLPGEILVIFCVDGSVDKRLKAVKEIGNIAHTEECNLILPKEGAMVMARMLMDGGKRLDASARSYLEEVVGSWSVLSRPLLQTECDKIILMAGDRNTITRRLLEVALPDYMNQGIFPFTNALLRKNADAVLARADRVFINPAETIKSIGFLASRFRKIKMYKEMKRHRVSPGEIQKALGMNGWGMKYFEQEIAPVTEADAEWFLVHLFQYQLQSREGGSDTLKDLLLTFCLRK